MVYRIVNGEEKQVFNKIVQYALKCSDHASVCTFRNYHKKDLENSFWSFLERVSPYSVGDSDSFTLPKNYTKGQKFHLYYLADDVKKCILEVPTLESWKAPHLPEDITFYINKKPWLMTISHEKMMFLNISDTEKLESILMLGGVVHQM